MNTSEWKPKRIENQARFAAMQRYRDWLTLMLKIKKQWIESWIISMAGGPVEERQLQPPFEPQPGPEPEPIEPPMPVISRQMFEPSGTLTAAAPGDFVVVDGSLYQEPGGAHLAGSVAACADPRVQIQTSPFNALGYFSSAGHSKVVLGCWFLFKVINTNALNKSAIMFLGDASAPTIQLVVSEGTLKAWSIYQDQTLQSFPFTPTANEWLYISFAAQWVSNTEWSVRFFYKHPKGNLTQWAEWNAVTCWTGSTGFNLAGYGMCQNSCSYEGRISACTLHSFENADYSDVVYPSEIMNSLKPMDIDHAVFLEAGRARHRMRRQFRRDEVKIGRSWMISRGH
jgi:hypothetical protein